MVDITVSGAERLPEKAYLSVRVGSVRRQCQYRPGSRFVFGDTPGGAAATGFALDVFQKVGSAQVRLEDLERTGSDLKGRIDVSLADGGSASVALQVADLPPDSIPVGKDGAALLDVGGCNGQPAGVTCEASDKAKSYLARHSLQKLLAGMLHRLLEAQPLDPVAFMLSHLQAAGATGPAPRSASAESEAAVTVAGEVGEEGEGEEEEEAGEDDDDDEPSGFAVDGSDPLPDLAEYHSFTAQVLQESPTLYDSLRNIRTPTGVTLAKCIKCGIDNLGHPVLLAPGLMAGDAHCYSVFRGVFDPVLRAMRSDLAQDRVQPLELDPAALVDVDVDPAGGHVQHVHLSLQRNLEGFPFSNACSWQERRAVEATLTEALASLKGDDLEGSYLPLPGSESFEACPDGMAKEDEASLHAEGLLFEEPDSDILISAGFLRHWPDARGIFRGQQRGLAVWVNEENHVRILSVRQGADFRQAFDRLARAEAALGEALRSAGHGFARDERLGYLAPSLQQLGSGLAVSATLFIPRISSLPEFQSLCQKLEVKTRRTVTFDSGSPTARKSVTGCWEVLRPQALGSSAAQELSAFAEACRQLVDLEVRLERGESVSLGGAGDAAEDAGLPSLDGDPRVVSVVARAQRNVAGFRFPPAISSDERRQVEALLVRALGEVPAAAGGGYLPLRGSSSHAARPGGMLPSEEATLEEAGLLFREPDSATVLSSGAGRHWPQARGVFSVASGGGFAAWINEEDHLRLWSRRPGADLAAALRALLEADAALRAALREVGHDFASSPRLGYLTSCPGNVGTALRLEVRARLPRLSGQPGLKKLLPRLGLGVAGASSDDGGAGGERSEAALLDVACVARPGASEVEQALLLLRGVRRLLSLEDSLERGEVVDLASVAC